MAGRKGYNRDLARKVARAKREMALAITVAESKQPTRASLRATAEAALASFPGDIKRLPEGRRGKFPL